MNRRDAVIGIGASTAALFTRWPSLHNQGAMAKERSAFAADVEIELRAEPAEVSILAGKPTRVWRYNGTVLAGPKESLQTIPNSYLGPTLRLNRGQNVRIRFRNNLPESSIVHWHGLDVPEAADGHPRFAIAPGQEYVYEFEVINRAGTYWYHPHPHGNTGKQVYQGLGGLIVVTDTEERALSLPDQSNDLTCVLQDRTFDAQNQFAYLSGGMMDQMHGLLGATMLVNGQPKSTFSLATRAYRLRILNASNSRVYKLHWDDGTPMTIIGADGGLLQKPLEQQYLTLAPSQRADVILDLSRHTVGQSVQLRSAPFPESEVGIDEGGMMGGGMGGGMGRGMGAMMGGGMGGASVSNGASLLLSTLKVERPERATFRLPAKLSTFGPEWDVQSGAPVRKIALDFRAGQWLLNGRTYEMDSVAPEEIVRAGSTQVWEVTNAGGMMGQQMAHPIHVHGSQFRVLSRVNTGTGAPPSVKAGIVDDGWRDTVLVLPHETVRMQLRFTKYPGRYLYHCHILEHEDNGMMRNFDVTA